VVSENETEKQLRKSVAAGAALTGTAIAGRPSWTPSLLYSSNRLTLISETVAKTHLSFDVDEGSQLIRCAWSFSEKTHLKQGKNGDDGPPLLAAQFWDSASLGPMRFCGRTGVALYGFFCPWVAFLVSGSQCCCSHWIFFFQIAILRPRRRSRVNR